MDWLINVVLLSGGWCITCPKHIRGRFYGALVEGLNEKVNWSQTLWGMVQNKCSLLLILGWFHLLLLSRSWCITFPYKQIWSRFRTMCKTLKPSSFFRPISLSPNTVFPFPCLLWQEAHIMVNESNVKRAKAEKRLKEATGKVGLATLLSLFVLPE